MRDLSEKDVDLISEAIRKAEVAFITEHVPPDDSFPEEIPEPDFWDGVLDFVDDLDKYADAAYVIKWTDKKERP